MITKEFATPGYTKERFKDYLDCLPRMFPNIVEVKDRIVKITAKDQEECENVKEAVWNHFYEVNFNRARKIVSLTERSDCIFHSSLPHNFSHKLFHGDKKSRLISIELETATYINIDFTGFIAIFGRKENVSQAIKMVNQMFDARVLDDTRVDSWTENLKPKGREETPPTKSFNNLQLKGKSTKEKDISNNNDRLITVWFKVQRDLVSRIIGKQGNKKREFEEKFNIQILVKNDSMDEEGVPVELSGFSLDDLNNAREEILYYVSRFDKNGAYSAK